jgi:hydroxyacylglutathione hydrolase
MAADPMDFELILTPGLGNAAFLIGAGREAVVVDPPRDAWRVMAAAERRGWRITHVLETHVHNDYLSGGLELNAALGSEILAPARGRYAFDHRPMEEGGRLELGDVALTARATPGHTPEHLAWEIAAEAIDRPTAIATGGSLLVGSAGRTDLLGSGATEELTHDQFLTLRRLATLPDSTVVLPTHGAGSFCSVGPADGARTTTIGRERARNPLLSITDEEVFRATLLGGLGPYPDYYAEMAPINRAGPIVVGHLPEVDRITADGLRAAVAAGAHVVDGRGRRAFAESHLPGSMNIELSDSFASYVGWFVPFGASVVLILPEPLDESTEEAVSQLFRIGFDRIAGVLQGGIDAWAAAGGALDRYDVTTAREMVDADAGSQLLDVRYPNEWRDEGAVAGAIELSIGDLQERLDTLPRDRPITVMCKSGARASIAASMLDAAGFDVRLMATGGAPDVAKARAAQAGDAATAER